MKKSKSIKEIAGDILLYFYARQRETGFALPDQINFGGIYSSQINYSGPENLKKISRKPADLYNAFRYLDEKHFIDFKTAHSSAADTFYNIRLSAQGIDIIEGVELNEQARRNFTINFNIKLADNINVDSLVKAQLGNLLKFGLT